MLHAGSIPAVLSGQHIGTGSQSFVAFSADQLNILGDRGQGLSAVAQGKVHGVLGHHAVGGQLTTGNSAHTRGNFHDGVLTRHLGRCSVLTLLSHRLQQGAQTSVRADDIGLGQLIGNQLISLVEHVTDVSLGGDGTLAVFGVGGVGGADNPVTLPGDDEEHGLFGLGEDTAGCLDAVAGHGDVHALRSQHLQALVLGCHGLRLFGPHAGCVDDVGGLDGLLVAGFKVNDSSAGDFPGGVLVNSGDLGAGGCQGTVACGGADEVDDQAGVIHAGIVELNGAGEGRILDAGEDLLGAFLGEVALGGHSAVAAGTGEGHGVVQADTHSGVSAFNHGHLEGPEEGLGLDQVGSGAFEQQATFLKGFGNQLEVKVVEVAQAAVYELGGPGAGASCPVACLNDGGA